MGNMPEIDANKLTIFCSFLSFCFSSRTTYWQLGLPPSGECMEPSLVCLLDEGDLGIEVALSNGTSE
jgi:hypothetical protein